MVKVVIPFIFIIIFFSGIILTSSDSLAEEPDSGPPPLARNPFVDAPYGRLNKTVIRSDTNPGMFIKKEDINKVQKVNGIILGGDHPAALVGHRVVKIGDTVDEFTVTDITRKGVSLSNGDRVIQLPFE